MIKRLDVNISDWEHSQTFRHCLVAGQVTFPAKPSMSSGSSDGLSVSGCLPPLPPVHMCQT